QAQQQRNASISSGGSNLQPAPPPPVGVSPAPSLTNNAGSRSTPSLPSSGQYQSSGSSGHGQMDSVTAAQLEYNQSQALLMEMIASASLPNQDAGHKISGQGGPQSAPYFQHGSTPSPSGIGH